MSKTKRRVVESHIQAGLGVGSRENRTISQNIEETATFQLAFGFSGAASEFAEGSNIIFEEDKEWSFPRGGPLSRGVKSRAVDSPSVKNCSAQPTNFPVGRRHFEGLERTLTLISSRYKILIVQTAPGVLVRLANMFSIMTTVEAGAGDDREDEEGEEEEERDDAGETTDPNQTAAFRRTVQELVEMLEERINAGGPARGGEAKAKAKPKAKARAAAVEPED